MSNEVRDNTEKNRYEILVDDEVAGFSTYERGSDRLTVTHTEIGDAYSGQGLAKELATGMLGDLREKGLLVVPECSFVRKFISRNPGEYLSLVPEEELERLGLDKVRA